MKQRVQQVQINKGNISTNPERQSDGTVPAILFLLGWFLSLILFVLAIGTMGPESYFYLHPEIDTIFAADFSEEGFGQIEPGMTRAEVEQLIGPPLRSTQVVYNPVASPAPNTVWTLQYTRDGQLGWWDFAWLGREVDLDANGLVTGTRQPIYRD